MAACTPTPTATQFSTLTSFSIETITTSTVTVLPDQFNTLVVTSCLGAVDIGGVCLGTNVVDTETNTVPGATITVPVIFTTSVPVFRTSATTLFAPCTTSSNNPPATTSNTGNGGNAVTGGSTSYILSTSELPPTTIVEMSSSTAANGSVIIMYQTITSSVPATVFWAATIVPIPQQSNNTVKIGPIIGGVAGGFFALLTIVGLGWLFLRRRRNWDDVFEDKTEDQPPGTLARKKTRNSRFLDDDLEKPKPYEYGLVGSLNSPPLLVGGSPPGSPPASEIGYFTDSHGRPILERRRSSQQSLPGFSPGGITTMFVPPLGAPPTPGVSIHPSSRRPSMDHRRASTATSTDALLGNSISRRPGTGGSATTSRSGRPSTGGSTISRTDIFPPVSFSGWNNLGVTPPYPEHHRTMSATGLGVTQPQPQAAPRPRSAQEHRSRGSLNAHVPKRSGSPISLKEMGVGEKKLQIVNDDGLFGSASTANTVLRSGGVDT